MKSSHRRATLHFFDYNEAVIKMIIKGSRVELNWLFNRMNFDPRVQIKYMDTKDKLADILTQGSFTRDQWNNLLRLFNILGLSSNSDLQKLAKKEQDGTGEEGAIAKLRSKMT